MSFITVQQGIDRLQRQYSRNIGEISETLFLDFFNELNYLAYRALIGVNAQRYISQDTIAVVANTQAYSLPSDFKQLRSGSIGGETGFFRTDTRTGEVTAMADAGFGGITVTASSNLNNGDTVVHTDFADSNYNGSFTVSNVVSGAYEINGTFTATGTGTWTSSNIPILPELQQTGFGETRIGYYLQNGKVNFTPVPTKAETIIIRYMPKLSKLTDPANSLVIDEEHLEMVMNWLDKNYGQWNIDIFKETNGDARFIRGFNEMITDQHEDSLIFNL
jgi:hypothetical protein